VLIVGLAYKPNVEDDRESPSYVLMEKLEALGATVDYHDPHVPVIRPSREYSHFAERQSVPWTAEAMSQYDAALIATAHDSVDHTQLTEWIPCVVDTRNALPVKTNCTRA
jgi:UDP-N-acetyl-D-glucosamine dehydrogenase